MSRLMTLQNLMLVCPKTGVCRCCLTVALWMLGCCCRPESGHVPALAGRINSLCEVGWRCWSRLCWAVSRRGAACVLDTCRTVTPERKGWARQESVTIREMRSLPGASGTPGHHRTIHASASTIEHVPDCMLCWLTHMLHLAWPSNSCACDNSSPARVNRKPFFNFCF